MWLSILYGGVRTKTSRPALGCIDKTAHDAIEKADAERERLHSIIDVIYTICELAGFQVEERIVLRDKKTGRVWR